MNRCHVSLDENSIDGDFEVHPAVSRTLFWPTFLWNVALGRWLKRRHWWDRIEPQILLGAMPLRRDVPTLAAEGVTGVINMCQEYAGPIDLYREHQIQQLHLPTVDFNPPSLEQVRQGVDFIEKQLGNGGTVYIHCKAGRARSATVLICYLIQHRQLSPDAAMQFILERRPHVLASLPKRQVVQDFTAQCHAKSMAQPTSPSASIEKK